jgi:hypothetical protein
VVAQSDSGGGRDELQFGFGDHEFIAAEECKAVTRSRASESVPKPNRGSLQARSFEVKDDQIMLSH